MNTISLADAIGQASRAVIARPDVALAQCREILRASPGEPQAEFLAGAALRRLGDPQAAIDVLGPLAERQSRSPQVRFELGLALAALHNPTAEDALKAATRLKPDWAEAWRGLADYYWLKGKTAEADEANTRALAAATRDPALHAAAQDMLAGRLAPAEAALRARLKEVPTDIAAIRMLAEIGTRLGRYGDAEALLARCLELAPAFLPARHNLAIVLYRQNRAAEALPHIDALLQADPADPGYRNLKAAALSLVGEYEGSIELYEGVLAEHPNQPKAWLSYGHALKTAGRQADSVAAYRRSVALEPHFGEAYWSLANLKTVRFSDEDIAAMQAQALRGAALSDDDRLHLHYALGKAFEDREEYEPSFRHYSEGARLRRGQITYDADETHAHMERSRALFSPAFFAERAGWGHTDPAPIFVVGLPRSGSTLVEQILASHSAIEGTMELPDIVAIAKSVGDAAKDLGPHPYPDALARLSAAEATALGKAYIDRTRIQRKLGRARFIDKMPNNFLHVGLIRMILPNAKIIDTRRNPMATCFSAFKQHFARGQNFSYDLTELGRYYRDYVALMAHFEGAAPGLVHRVNYEEMVEDTEGEVRRLLDHLDLPFEEACLNFHQNARPVRTASSEQVRQPIFRDGLDQWRCYEKWLEPLAKELAGL